MSSSEDSRQNELKTDLKLKRLQKTISTLRRQLSLSLLVIRCISGLVRVPNLYFGIQNSWGTWPDPDATEAQDQRQLVEGLTGGGVGALGVV